MSNRQTNRDGPRSSATAAAERPGAPLHIEDASRNPFAKRSSRVLRWLLLHPDESYSIRGLAQAVHLSEAVTSRVVRALDDAALVSVAHDPDDERRRLVSVSRAAEALAAWRPFWEARRVRRLHWDIGTTTPQDTLSALEEATRSNPALDWAVGGLAGATYVRRAVEPADVLVWLREEQLEAWAEELTPARVRPGEASLRAALAPDPFIFELTSTHDGVRVADPVQLWLDCATEGERAGAAADAIREEMGW